MTAAMRRGACPALSSPMQTGDGLLVRLNALARGFSCKSLIGLCESAARHSNGMVEVTARGSLQIRGLTPSSVRKLAQEVDALGIAMRDGVPVETGPLAGLDPDEITDPRPLAEAIRRAADAAGLATRLGPKVSVVVDGGGRIDMDDLLADVRLTAVAHEQETFWRLGIGGNAATARPLGLFFEEEACDAALAILETIASLGREGRGRDLNSRQPDGLPPSGVPDLSSRGEMSLAVPCAPVTNEVVEAEGAKQPISPLEGEMAGRPEGGGKGCGFTRLARPRPGPAKLGIFPLADTTYTLGIALSFGSMPAERIAELAQAAASLGATEIRPAPGRMLLALGLAANSVPVLQTKAANLGFVTEARDPRLFIAACPGAPDCTSGRLATRTLAERFARENGNVLDGSFTLHVSGCAKGCAHPGPAALTLVGSESGAGLVVNGAATGNPAGHRSAATSALGLDQIATRLRAARRPNETTAACLERIGATDIAIAFGTDRA
jgi:precorrin-3B synthase